MKRALVVRYGAYGDMIIISPVIKKLKELGYHVTLNTTDRGLEIYKHDKRIDDFIKHDESIPLDKIRDFWDKQKEEFKPDFYVNFSESLECNVALHPVDPTYIHTKQERYAQCNHNYYDITAQWADLDNCDKRPSLVFTDAEETLVQTYLRKDSFNILWSLSGSGKNKVYPWTDYVMGEVFKNFDNIHFITIGDKKCQLLETIEDKDITNLSGKIGIRESLLLTKYVDLVISPDTGTLHASGCFDTPKIGLLGHTTKKNITDYFINDHSIEADCACAPCFRLIYEHDIQCPIECVTHGAWCMAVGIKPEVLYARISELIPADYRRRENIPETVSDMRS